LNRTEGHSGHFVVIKGYGYDKLVLHDPGLPLLEDRIVSNDTFEQAWGYPKINVKNLIAFRYAPSHREQALINA
jgi:hypothetical protein